MDRDAFREQQPWPMRVVLRGLELLAPALRVLGLLFVGVVALGFLVGLIISAARGIGDDDHDRQQNIPGEVLCERASRRPDIDC